MVRKRRKRLTNKELAGELTLGNVAVASIAGITVAGPLGAGIGAGIGAMTAIPLFSSAKKLNKRKRKRK